MGQLHTSRKSGLLGHLLALLLAMLAVGAASAAMPPAGETIYNRAWANYWLSPESEPERIDSNTVLLRVAAVEAFTLTEDQTVQVAVGGTAQFPHTLTNTGNVDLDLTLTLRDLTGDDFDFANLSVVLDANGNGRVDAGEVVLRADAVLRLPRGQAIRLVVVAPVGAMVSVGQRARLELRAASPAGTERANTDTAIITGGVNTSITKGVDPKVPVAGGRLTYLIGAYTDPQGARPQAQALTVDGQPMMLVYVRDRLPVNTVLVDLDATDGRGYRLYHLAGTTLDHFVSAPPTDLSRVDYVGYGVRLAELGQGFSFRFTVQLTPRAGGTIDNTAYLIYIDPTTGRPVEQPSNTTSQALAVPLPTISFYTDSDFTRPTQVAVVGQPLYVQAEVGSANTDPTMIETIKIALRSTVTGDLEQYTAVETGPNTGIFRILDPWVPTADQATATKGNASIETVINDVVTAQVTDGHGQSATAQVVMSPTNVVYDALTNAPLAAATVTLFEASEGQARQATKARVLMPDGITPAPNPVTTVADGRYSFPLIEAGNYVIVVEPPRAYRFPSVVAPADLPADRVTHLQASFGKPFGLPTAGTVRADVPLDPGPLTGFNLEKTVDRTVAEIGDFLNYTLTLHNANDLELTNLSVSDRLPQGFAYVLHSARLDGVPLATEPAQPRADTLVFSLPDLAPQKNFELTYRVRVGMGAKIGRNANTAVADTSRPGGAAQSNIASAIVQITGGVFSDRGVLAGTVFVDTNGDTLQNVGEPGVPGVVVLLDDGTYVQTDVEGKYSLYGIRSGTHVAKVDETTLPVGAQLVSLTNRHGDLPGLAFVDIKNGELFRADFGLAGGNVAVDDEVTARRAAATAALEGSTLVNTPLRPDSESRLPGDVRGMPSAGVIGGAAVPGMAPIGDPPKADNLPPAPVAPSQQAALEAIVSGLDNTLGLVGLADGDRLPAQQVTLRVKSDPQAEVRVLINGKELAGDRLGNELLIPDRALRVREYYGIEFREGPNTIEVVKLDGFGNERERQTLNVVAPGKLAQLTIIVPEEGQPATDTMVVNVRLEIADANGTPVTARTPVTVESSLGAWVTPDLDEVEPGLQVFVRGGVAELGLRAPTEPGEALIRATTNLINSQAKLRFVPYLRPLVGAGLLEARIGLGGREGGPGPDRPADPFESELRALAGRDGSLQGGVRGSLFFKGKVLGSSLLTLGYDSEKDARERLFRDIQPDEYYPVYGDSGLKGYDAQSTSKLFARLQNGMSYVQWGDMHTDSTDEVRQLGSYYRSLTGLLGHYETKHLRVNAFGSYDDARQIIQEYAANGTSGPFRLGYGFYRVNSERVEVIVRDRNQPTVVLSVTPMTRFTDYTVDPSNGDLLFRQPIASRDGNLNPVFIRVSYEVEEGGKRYLVYGADASWSLGQRLRLGGSLIFDDNPGDALQLRTANLSYQIDPKTLFVAEVANTWSRANGTGSAGRVEFTHEGSRLSARAFALTTGSKFYNPSALSYQGRTEMGLKAHYLFDAKTRLTAETLYTRDAASAESLTGASLSVTRKFGSDAELEVGMRHAKGSLAATIPGVGATSPQQVDRVDFTTARIKLSGTMPGVRALRVYGEYETDLGDLAKRVLAVGAEYQLNNRLRAYARHELLSSIAGRYMLDEQHQQNVTQLGIEADYMRDGQVFSEYRTQDAMNGRETQAAVGLRNRWNLLKSLSVDTTFEHIRTFEGLSNNDSLAMTGQLLWKPNKSWVTTGRLEGRWGHGSNTALGSLGVVGKVGRDWSVLGRYMFTSDARRGDFGSGTRTQQRLSVGAAWRDTATSRVSGLARYEFRSDRDSGETNPSSRLAHILSSNINYRLARPTVLTGHYAAKFATDRTGGFKSSSSAQLISARWLQDLSKRLDFGLTTSYYFGGGESGFAAGAELGYQLGGGLWLSGGWNIANYDDDDLAGLGYTDNGPYMRIRFKFDENLLR